MDEADLRRRALANALADALARDLPPQSPADSLKVAAAVLAIVEGPRACAAALRKLARQMDKRGKAPVPKGRPAIDDERILAAMIEAWRVHPSASIRELARTGADIMADREMIGHSKDATAKRLAAKLALARKSENAR
jgi:hypothetical protein